MHRVLLLNKKGGCGKTTIAVNLSLYFAEQGVKTALLDFDPQQSSLNWLDKIAKNSSLPLQGIDAASSKKGLTRSFQLNPEAGTQLLIIDTPAAFDNMRYSEFLSRADSIIVPVLPSDIDVHSTARFIGDLLLIGKIRKHNKRIGVIANRVSGNLRPFEPLELFLSRLEIPIISQLGNLTCDDLPQGYNPSWKLTDGYSYMLDRMGWPPLIRWIWDAIDAEAVNRPLMTLGEPMTDRVAIKQQDQILEKA
ncbi:MAG: ParA family protein [Candidatus Sedimenticola sp. 4PFRAG1]